MKPTAQFFKVLADEARLKMLWLLFNHEELCVCDMMAVLEITQSKASRHLGTLRHAHLVTDRKDGLWSYYTLCPVRDELAQQHLEALRQTLAELPDAGKLLAKLHGWLEAKRRGTVCPADSARGGLKTKRAARTARARAAGESR